MVAKSVASWKVDSGTPGAPISYRAAEGERVTFFGRTILPVACFSPASDETFLSRLVDRTAGKRILVADLRAQGITDFGELTRHGWSMEPHDRVPPVILAALCTDEA